MPYSSYRDRIGKLKYGSPNVCEIKTNLEKHVEDIDNSFNSVLTLNHLIVSGGLKLGYSSITEKVQSDMKYLSEYGYVSTLIPERPAYSIHHNVF